jgi:hypothetical protein
MNHPFFPQAGRTLPRSGGRTLLPLLVLPLLIWVGGCGGNLTSGGLSDVEVFVSGNDPEASSAPGRLPLPAVGMVAQQAGPPVISGTVTATLRVEMLRGDRQWVEVTDGPQTVTVGLSGAGPSLLAARPLEAGRYIGVRTTFLRVEANVEGGLVVDGASVTGPIPVELPAAGLRVEEGLFLELEERDPARLMVALNSQLWLRLVITPIRRVPQTVFRQAVRVRVF